MSNKTVTIIPNETTTNAKFYTVSGTITYHQEAIKKYIYQNEISLTTYDFYDLSNIYFELLEQGFALILTDETDNYKNAIIYLPINISPKQHEFFLESQETLEKYQTGILSIEGEKFKNITNNQENPLKALITEIEKRKIPSTTKAKNH